MKSGHPSLAHWAFRHHAETEDWSWARYGVDGQLLERSASFSSFGKTITDAIRSGFLPREHQWKVISRHTALHFPTSTARPLGAHLPRFDLPPRQPKSGDTE